MREFMVSPVSVAPHRRTLYSAFWAAFVGAIVFSVWYAGFSWYRYEKDSRARLFVETDLIAQSMQGLLNGHATTLKLLSRQLRRVDVRRHPRRARTLLQDYQRADPGVASVNLIAPSGQVMISTAVAPGRPLPDFRDNPAIWPGLRRALQDHGLRVDQPLYGPLVKHWVIRLSHTVFSRAGRPQFIIATPLRYRRLATFLRRLPLRPGTAVGLIHGDRRIEGRWPVPHGNLDKMLLKPPQPGALLRALQAHPHARQGSYEGFVTVGHTYRFGAFTRLRPYDLTAFVSIPRDQWLAAWWRRHIEFPLIFMTIALGFALISYRRILTFERDWDEQRRNWEERLATQATHDIQTGLPNREGLRLVFGQALARMQRQERLLAVGFLDIDDFKPINDTYGHAAGDQLLKEMAKRLQMAVRDADTVVRLGGDEFVLLLEGLSSIDELNQILARLQTEIDQPFVIQGNTVLMTVSLGLSIYPFDDVDTDLLLRHADQAMYMAKARAGRSRDGWAQLYHPGQGAISRGAVP
ncbi:MAG: diguanylate cyclase domain-containing protein [Acidiferrobacter sp.]